MKPTDRRTAASSSTICTTRSRELGIGNLSLGQCELEDGAALVRGLAPDPASMRLDDGSADRKTDSHSGYFRCDERLEKLRRDALAYSGARVLHADCDELVGAIVGGDG